MNVSSRSLRWCCCLVLLAGCRRSPGKAGAAKPSAAPVAVDPSKPRLVPSDGGATVYDVARDVTWLADANLAATQTFGVDGINPSGSMGYKSALRWVDALNQARHLGRNDWTLPTTPAEDAGCDGHNRYSFGFGCRNSAFAMLYAALGLQHSQTAVPIKPRQVKGFSNFQPYLYWSASPNANHPENERGFTTFSFNNGFQGSNVAKNRIYVIAMVKGRFDPTNPADKARVVFDGENTWLADANLAATQTFGVAGIAPTGAMAHDTAERWVDAMNKHGGKGFLGQSGWQLPPTITGDRGCSAQDFGYGCTGSPLGRLYYQVLGLKTGEPVVRAPDTPVGPFRNVEPYLYWSCHAAADGKSCSPRKEDPVAGFGWSFSLGNGFQGTTTRDNALYVTVYHPGRSDKQ